MNGNEVEKLMNATRMLMRKWQEEHPEIIVNRNTSRDILDERLAYINNGLHEMGF